MAAGRFLAWLGRCVIGVLAAVFYAIGRGLAAVGRSIGAMLRLLFHVTLRQPVRNEVRTAEAVERQWRRTRRRHGWHRCKGLAHMFATLLLSDHGVLVALFRFAVPVTCLAFLSSVVIYGAGIEYGVTVTMGSETVGMVANEAVYEQAAGIVRERLSYLEAAGDVPLGHAFTLEMYDGTTPLLTAGELADSILRHAGIELCQSVGVYVNEAFLGAVPDSEPIETALREQLSRYSAWLGGVQTGLYYADEVRYLPGLYPVENQVDTQALIGKLTHVERKIRRYIAGSRDTVFSVARRYSVTVEDIRRLNPDLDPDSEMIPLAKSVRVPTEERFLPIVYTMDATALVFTDYDTVRTESSAYAKGDEVVVVRGEKGEKRQYLQITYTDGCETARKVHKVRTLRQPVTEEVAVGTFEAQPYSKTTVLNGNGHFCWPVNGGRITSLFGGDHNHRGLDIGAAGGSEIYAGDAGEVVYAGWHDSYGNYLIIAHGDGYRTLY